MRHVKVSGRPGRSVVRSVSVSVSVQVIQIFGVMLINTIRFLLIIRSGSVRFSSDRI